MPILQWRSPAEQALLDEQENERFNAEAAGLEYDPLLHSMTRRAETMLLPEDMDCFFAWQLTTPDVTKYIWTIRNMTIVDLLKVYMMKRVEVWQSLEPKTPFVPAPNIA